MKEADSSASVFFLEEGEELESGGGIGGRGGLFAVKQKGF